MARKTRTHGYNTDFLFIFLSALLTTRIRIHDNNKLYSLRRRAGYVNVLSIHYIIRRL